MAGVFVGRGLLSQVFTADERYLERPHVCHSAKFERNQTIPGRVIAIYLIGPDCHPPSWIFEAGIRGPLRTLRNLVKVS